MITQFEESPHKILFQRQLSDADVAQWLDPVGFTDSSSAYRTLQQLVEDPQTRLLFAESLPHLLTALAETTNPDHVLTNFERLVQNSDNQAALFEFLAEAPRTIEVLVTLFTGSQFLTEIMLRYPNYLHRLSNPKKFATAKSAGAFDKVARATINAIVPPHEHQEEETLTQQLNALRRFQRWEMLRIGTADMLSIFDLVTVTEQLSHLADSLVRTGLTLASQQTDTSAADFVVLAMGKLGGEELNYSSDIDLLFLVKENASTYTRMGQQLIDSLTRMTAEGFLYRVDMRLRPWGRTGALVSSFETYLKYLHRHARLWEKQALLKARVIAGNKTAGETFLRKIKPLLYEAEAETVRAEVHALKQRIEEQLRRKGRQWGEVKLGEGSIRDIEFIVQYQQLAHGHRLTNIHTPNTLRALAQLYSAQLITAHEYRVLHDGYIFLRTVEHHLQLMHYRQTHTLPQDETPLNHLAQRLGFRGKNIGNRFIAHYQQHSTVIRVVYQQQFGLLNAAESPADEPPDSTKRPRPSPALLPHLVRMHPTYIAAFSEIEIEHHAQLIEQLTEETPIKVEVTALNETHWQVTIVGYDYIGILSLICGLMFIYDVNILEGHVFSYGASVKIPPAHKRRRKRRHQPNVDDLQRKFVDVFVVSLAEDTEMATFEAQYSTDLQSFMARLQEGEQRETQGELAKRMVKPLQKYEQHSSEQRLYPIDIKIDNEAAQRHTVLRIDAPDTMGFLYELTNALALNGINVRRMNVETAAHRVQDTLYVTDAYHNKITDPEKQQELRLATALIKQFTHLLPRSPNPESALLHFREFVGHLFTRDHWAEELSSLERPEVLTTLARLLGVSDFLWDDFLRMQHANLFPVLENVEELATAKTQSQLRAELEIILRYTEFGDPQIEALNSFKDREMFRIDMRQIQGYITEFGQFSAELSDLAEIVVAAAYRIASYELIRQFGLPKLENRHPCEVSICALGKCGGRELGFASDIELMVIYEGNGRTTGPNVITTAEFFNKLVQKLSDIIQAKREGIFELDLRLRPYGNAGNLGVSLESFQRYFNPQGEAWPYERQALVKLRTIAGNSKFGRKVVQLRDQFVYTDEPFDAAAMRAMRERQLRHSVTAGTLNAKLSGGGLVDIEYLVQGLQITHGYQNPSLRVTNTAEALSALHAAGLIPTKDYEPLRAAHIFLQRLIDALRVVRGNTKDLTVPEADSDEFAFLARRLNYEEPAQLQHDVAHHTTHVQEINQRLLG